MAPEPGITFPTRRFVITRLDGAVETTVAISALLPSGYATDQAMRETTYQTARGARDTNPGVVYLIYGPTNGGAHADDDRIWDSRGAD